MYRKEIRVGDWVSPSKIEYRSRHEVRRFVGNTFLVTRDCGSSEIQVPRAEMAADWVRWIPEKSPELLPAWVVEGAEILWNRLAISAGKERVDRVPIRVSRVLPTQRWFSTYNIEDGQLFFWAAHTIVRDYNPNDFRPMQLNRFNRENVI